MEKIVAVLHNRTIIGTFERFGVEVDLLAAILEIVSVDESARSVIWCTVAAFHHV